MKVQVEGKRGSYGLRIADGIFFLKFDTLVVELPEKIKVLSAEGPVTPSKGSKFYVTVETIDPCHAVVELPDSWCFG